MTIRTRRSHAPPSTPRRYGGALLALLFLTTTHLPGVVALAAPQIFARVGPGVSGLPASFAAFTDPSFGELSDAINVASGNAYVQTANLNWNNLLSPGTSVSTGGTGGSNGGGTTTPPATPPPPPTPCKPGKPCIDPVGPQPASTSASQASTASTSNTNTTPIKTQTTGLLRLFGFKTAPGSPTLNEYALGLGDGGQQLFRPATAAEVSAGPSWVKERYANKSGVVFFISKPQNGVQTDETWLLGYTLSSGRIIAHYYDHQGTRTTFYDDGEFADYTQTPHEQYRGAKDKTDPDGLATSTPKTEFTYTGPGNGHLRRVKDSWGRVTTYQWDESAGVIKAVNMLLRDENDDTKWARRTEYDYGTEGNQRVVTSVTYRTSDGRGGTLSREFKLAYQTGANSEVLLTSIKRPVLGSQSSKTTTYFYDTQNRVIKTTVLGEPDLTLTYGQSPAEPQGAGGLMVTQTQQDKITVYHFSPEGWLRRYSVRDLNPVSAEDRDSTKGTGLTTVSTYDANGRVTAQTLPGGKQVRNTYDRHGNLATTAEYRAATDTTPERQTTYVYDDDNQVKSVTQEATASGSQGRFNDQLASDATYSYEAVQKAYTYVSHASVPIDNQRFVANQLIGEALSVGTVLKHTTHTALDIRGRVTDVQLYLGGQNTPYTNTSYSYPTEGTTQWLVYPSAMTVVGHDKGQSIRQYADQPSVKNDNGLSTDYFYDEYGNVVREYISQSHVYKWDGTTARIAQRHHWWAYNGFGQPVWDSLWEYHPETGLWPQLISRQWLYHSSGELNVLWDGTPKHVTKYGYFESGNNLGRVKSISEGMGDDSASDVATSHKMTIFDYDVYGRPNRVKVDGFETKTTYDTLDRPVEVNQPDYTTTITRYDLNGQPWIVTTRSNDGYSFMFTHNTDSFGREYLTETPTGNIRTYYDAFDRPVKITDDRLTMNAAGADRSTYFKYDSAGNLIKKLSPVLSSASSQTPLAYKDARRPYESYEYDLLDRQTGKGIMVSGAAINPTDFVAPTSATLAWTRTSYDVFDRPSTVTDPDGYETLLTYDNSGNVVTTEREVWKKTEAEYDTVKNFDRITTRTAYDALSRPVQTVDGRGNSKKAQYTFFGPTAEINERGITTKQYTYTPDGLLQATLEPDPQSDSGMVTTEYREYTTRQFPAKIYRALMTTEAAPNTGALTSYEYDFAGRPTQTILPATSNVPSATITQTYHSNGQVKAMTDANGFPTTMEYDWAGRLIAKHEKAREGSPTDSAAGLGNGLHSTYNYDASGNLTKKTERGLITEYKSNSLGKVISESHPRVGESTATNWKLTTYRLDGLPTAKTSFSYQGNLAATPDILTRTDSRITHTTGNMNLVEYSLRGLRVSETSWGTNHAREYLRTEFVNGLGQRYLQKFIGDTGIYAEQKSDEATLLGHANSVSFWRFDENSNLLEKWDTPMNGDSGSVRDATDKQNWFIYVYSPSNKETKQTRSIRIRAKSGVPSNVLTTTYGGAEGIYLAASGSITTTSYTRRDQIEKSTTEGKALPSISFYGRQDRLSDTGPSRHQRYSYYLDGRVQTVWTGNGYTDQARKTIDSYDQRGRETSVSDENKGQNLSANGQVSTVYTADGETKSSVTQDGVLVYESTVRPSVGGLIGYEKTKQRRKEEPMYAGAPDRFYYWNSETKIGYGGNNTNGTARPSDAVAEENNISRASESKDKDYYTRDAIKEYNSYGLLASTTIKNVWKHCRFKDGSGNCTDYVNGDEPREIKLGNEYTLGDGFLFREGKAGSREDYVASNEYTLDSVGNRLAYGGYKKRYNPQGQVASYNLKSNSTIGQFGNMDDGSRYNDFRYDPYGDLALTSTGQISEMGDREYGMWLKEYAIFRDFTDIIKVGGAVQTMNRWAGSYMQDCDKGPNDCKIFDYYFNSVLQYRDATYSLFDSFDDGVAWNGTQIFAIVRSVNSLDAPLKSLSNTLKINPLDITAPTLPKLVDPTKISPGVSGKSTADEVRPVEKAKTVVDQSPKQLVQVGEPTVGPVVEKTEETVLMQEVPPSFDDGQGFAMPLYANSLIEVLASNEDLRSQYRNWLDQVTTVDDYSLKQILDAEKTLGDADRAAHEVAVATLDLARKNGLGARALQNLEDIFKSTSSLSPIERLNKNAIVSLSVFAGSKGVGNEYLGQYLEKVGDAARKANASKSPASLGANMDAFLNAVDSTVPGWGPVIQNGQIGSELGKKRGAGPFQFSDGIFALLSVEMVQMNKVYSGEILDGLVIAGISVGGRAAASSIRGRSAAKAKYYGPSTPNGTRLGCGRNSFSPLTPVQTLTGLVAISALTIGTPVLAFNEQTGENGYYPITAVHKNVDPAITYLTLTDPDQRHKLEFIETTPEHPFYVTERSDTQPRPKPEGHRELSDKWVGAGHLKIGDKIKQADGTLGLVANVINVQKTQEMFNLTVDEAHTYYVGQDGWLVHNEGNGLTNIPQGTKIYKYVNEIDYERYMRTGMITASDGRVFLTLDQVPERFANQLLFAGSRQDTYAGKGSHVIIMQVTNPEGIWVDPSKATQFNEIIHMNTLRFGRGGVQVVGGGVNTFDNYVDGTMDLLEKITCPTR
ncbi:hypothetical protein K7W42_12770 [Deinococcus sp. HMF7604]|uniref:polymorphic toxin-type HINT domain-containing protein n=1 Tax=Deinococcus betulae TaxID=2873312 RepID=UPI001CC9D319|nr:polymorphic toxin-type HINT domain-containing protein [Deinococcus betulae]MBZ9751733.1 hypothetical protein [Deinococcus betulae]